MVAYAGTYDGGAFASFDGGVHWSPVTGLSVAAGASYVASDPSNPTHVFVSSGNGLSRSQNGGGAGRWSIAIFGPASWSWIRRTRSVLYSWFGWTVFFAAPTAGQLGGAKRGSRGGRRRRSPSIQRARTPSTPGLGTILAVRMMEVVSWDAEVWAIPSQVSSLVVDPHDSAIVYAAAMSAGRRPGSVRSGDAGGTWAAGCRTFPSSDVHVLALAASPDRAWSMPDPGGEVWKIHGGLDAPGDPPGPGSAGSTR